MMAVRKYESAEDLTESTYTGGANILKAGIAFSDAGAGGMVCIASCVVQNSSGSSSNFAQARMFSFSGASSAHTDDRANESSAAVWRGAGGMDVIDAGNGLVEVYLGGG